MCEARLIVYKAARGSAELRAVLCIALTIGVKHDIQCKLTCSKLYDMLIAGRDDAFEPASPLHNGMRYLPPATCDGWRLYFYFLWLFML